jgi:hypothetical protein
MSSTARAFGELREGLERAVLFFGVPNEIATNSLTPASPICRMDSAMAGSSPTNATPWGPSIDVWYLGFRHVGSELAAVAGKRISNAIGRQAKFLCSVEVGAAGAPSVGRRPITHFHLHVVA